MFLATKFFLAAPPQIFEVNLFNPACFRSCGKVSGRSVEASLRKRGEKKKHHGQNISPSGTVVPGGLIIIIIIVKFLVLSCLCLVSVVHSGVELYIWKCCKARYSVSFGTMVKLRPNGSVELYHYFQYFQYLGLYLYLLKSYYPYQHNHYFLFVTDWWCPAVFISAHHYIVERLGVADKLSPWREMF